MAQVFTQYEYNQFSFGPTRMAVSLRLALHRREGRLPRSSAKAEERLNPELIARRNKLSV